MNIVDAVCMHKRASATCFSVLLLAALLSLCSGCAGPLTAKKPAPSAPASNAPLNPHYPSHRGPRAYEVGFDVSTSRARANFALEKEVVADWITQAVQVNSAGILIYIGFLDSHPYTTPILTITIPPLDADPVLSLQPAPTPGPDPYANKKEAQAVAEHNIQARIVYQHALAHNHAALAEAQAFVASETQKLHALQPPQEDANAASDIGDYLGQASQHLRGVQGETYLLLLLPLSGTVPSTLARTLALPGVRVRVLWHMCSDALSCQNNLTYWQGVFQHAGTHDILFFDSAQTSVVSNPFGVDTKEGGSV